MYGHPSVPSSHSDDAVLVCSRDEHSSLKVVIGPSAERGKAEYVEVNEGAGGGGGEESRACLVVIYFEYARAIQMQDAAFMEANTCIHGG